ncbi:ClpXP adapter SpxH family protein [Dyadobacter aurulentus]|uniref:ClpXP adapter SpxH family protein n=1 Tax=Dyadobacter sp. UC 10 TaxID=2605428 RepID=UPI0011F366E5|nr:ClpXP adapter SpxH family protein [Dyadobacter sp. UC 10]KAA0992291.1 DsbA family protein [Dyadobacter sp. UC 10]
MENTNNNPLLCDIESGVCEMPDMAAASVDQVQAATRKGVRLIYFTDPICSSCWGIEPQLRKLKLEYGQHFEIDYRMGGLLPDWSYNSGGISKPSDVAHHWDEVSRHYDMPIDGDVWLEDPLDSSYPPSIAFKAAQLQSSDKAIQFLRALREMLFLQKINIAKWEHMAVGAKTVGLDVEQLENDFDGRAKDLFRQDLELAAQLGVRGFPTMFFVDEQGSQEKVYGTKPYQVYEAALLKQLPGATKSNIDTDWKALFNKFNTLTLREFSELSQIPRPQAESLLVNQADAGNLSELTTKNGSLWRLVGQ